MCHVDQLFSPNQDNILLTITYTRVHTCTRTHNRTHTQTNTITNQHGKLKCCVHCVHRVLSVVMYYIHTTSDLDCLYNGKYHDSLSEVFKHLQIAKKMNLYTSLIPLHVAFGLAREEAKQNIINW